MFYFYWCIFSFLKTEYWLFDVVFALKIFIILHISVIAAILNFCGSSGALLSKSIVVLFCHPVAPVVIGGVVRLADSWRIFRIFPSKVSWRRVCWAYVFRILPTVSFSIILRVFLHVVTTHFLNFNCATLLFSLIYVVYGVSDTDAGRCHP